MMPCFRYYHGAPIKDCLESFKIYSNHNLLLHFPKETILIKPHLPPGIMDSEQRGGVPGQPHSLRDIRRGHRIPQLTCEEIRHRILHHSAG